MKMMTTWTYEWILAIINTNHITILLVASISGSWNIFIGITLHLIGIIVFFTSFPLLSPQPLVLPSDSWPFSPPWCLTEGMMDCLPGSWLLWIMLSPGTPVNTRMFWAAIHISLLFLLLQIRALGVAPVALSYSVFFLLVVLYFPPSS